MSSCIVGDLLGASLRGGDGTGQFMSQENGWESLRSVNKPHGECWLLLCTALVDCLSLGGGATPARWKGRHRCTLAGGLAGCENLWM